jgi:hypothetical protein
MVYTIVVARRHMKIASRDVVVWAPRIVGLGLSAFLALFALDSLSNPQGVLETTIAVVMGLVPGLGILGTVLVGWRHPAVASAVFGIFAVIYSLSARDYPGWIALIAGPLALETVLFFLSWRGRSESP